MTKHGVKNRVAMATSDSLDAKFFRNFSKVEISAHTPPPPSPNRVKKFWSICRSMLHIPLYTCCLLHQRFLFYFYILYLYNNNFIYKFCNNLCAEGSNCFPKHTRFKFAFVQLEQQRLITFSSSANLIKVNFLP